MTATAARADSQDLPDLLADSVRQAERLARQHLTLLTAELGSGVRQTAGAAAELGAGAALLAAGGVLSAAAAVHLIHRITGLPLWACYGLSAAIAGAAGAKLLTDGKARVGDLRWLTLPQTTAALQDDVEWLKDQVTAE